MSAGGIHFSDSSAITWNDADHDSYNDYGSKISVHLVTVYHNARNMKDDLDMIELYWGQAMDWWNKLKLSWVGGTQREVEDFQAKVDKVRAEIFGTSKKDPGQPGVEVLDKPGLYQQVQGVALGATRNYESTDLAVADMFNRFVSGMTGPPPPAMDQVKPPISETF